MDIKYGLVSSDSHGNVNPETWTSRMSAKRWGDRIPHIAEITDPELIAKWDIPPDFDLPIQRWLVAGKIIEPRGVANGRAIAGHPTRRYFYQNWEEVPLKLYDPATRLTALDEDRVDAEVLYSNGPVQGAYFEVPDDDDAAEFELASVKAHNDEFAHYREVSDRYIPLALIPYRSDIDDIVAEVRRAVDIGHRGINMLAEPSRHDPRLHHFNDRYWDPLWAVCQELEISVNWHGTGELHLSMPRSAGGGGAGGLSLMQFIPNLLFSGVLERFPKLQFVCAEAGAGWINYVLEASDHEWHQRHLWTEGVPTPPSELFRRNVHVTFWHETAGIELRHKIGVENIMFLSDYPHHTSTWPESHDFIERAMKGVPEDERKSISYQNVLDLYKV